MLACRLSISYCQVIFIHSVLSILDIYQGHWLNSV